jgi:hypothetical protein
MNLQRLGPPRQTVQTIHCRDRAQEIRTQAVVGKGVPLLR